MSTVLKRIFILAAIGMLVSAQQASSENVFSLKKDRSLERLSLTRPEFGEGGGGFFVASPPDTLESFDIELEEEEGPGFYKELAIFLIVAAVVGYMVVQLIKPGEDEGDGTNGGKEPPVQPIIELSVPLSR